jgi:deoxyribodipyrimidine photo-lyase
MAVPPPIPEDRVTRRNADPARDDGDYVLYWMTAARRTHANFALQHAIHRAHELGRPLLVFEPLRCGYEWASDRFHRFVVDGMIDNARSCAAAGVAYLAYVEPEAGAGRGLLGALAARACVVIGDEFPAFFHPRMTAAAARTLDVQFETADSNGLLPLRAADHLHLTAYSFRRFAQRALPEALENTPLPEPLKRLHADLRRGTEILPDGLAARYPGAMTSADELRGLDLSQLPIDHAVHAIDATPGGHDAAARRLGVWLDENVGSYAEERNQPFPDRTSQLSSYLHFGHIGAHEVFGSLAAQRGWSLDDIGDERRGARKGFWNMGESEDAFLDQLVTWREVGLNFCHLRDDYDRYESLPDWAQATLAAHANDPRPYTYSAEEFEAAATHEPIWNAAQRQLRREGRIHNYLRMLWGKKILHWSESPLEALEIMLHLNNKYALDGRDPNSYSGIFWCLGRYDRPWGPEREVFGKIRFMTCANTARKLKLGPYLDAYAADDAGDPDRLF